MHVKGNCLEPRLVQVLLLLRSETYTSLSIALFVGRLTGKAMAQHSMPFLIGCVEFVQALGLLLLLVLHDVVLLSGGFGIADSLTRNLDGGLIVKKKSVQIVPDGGTASVGSGEPFSIPAPSADLLMSCIKPIHLLFCLSVCPSVCPSVRLSVRLSVHPSVHTSVHLHIHSHHQT